MSTEKERETQVYMAKLAEQAERYEGFLFFSFPLIVGCFSCRFLLLRIWVFGEFMNGCGFMKFCVGFCG